jgi:YD repeat-containing protein
MVAIVTGNGVGLGKSSAEVLGQGGQLGLGQLPGAAGSAYVNASNGNLVIQRQDELLIGRGPDIGVYQTYNSQGGLDFDNNDNWQVSLYRQLSGRTGTLNAAGSTITRTAADGSQLVYTYDSTAGSATLGKYVNKDGSGSYDTLTYASGSNTWVWQDGNSRIKESYSVDPTDSSKWRITGVTDLDNNSLTYTYSTVSGLTTLINKVTSANGEITQLIYNTTKQLTQINVINSSSVTTTRIRYTYESTAPTARLLSVSTDLTPADGSITDNNTYTTTYTYEGASNRIASISNSDGSKVSFTYETSGLFRLLSISDYAINSSTISGTTSIAYPLAGMTVVTDANGVAQALEYDGAGQLIAFHGVNNTHQYYIYNTNGDVTQVTDNRGNWTKYTYDAQGNQLSSQDNLGNTVTRIYGSNNELLTQTLYIVPDANVSDTTLAASGAQTTRYTYDSNNHVRFTISAEGRVTEYRYNANGQVTSTHQYTDHLNSLTGNQTEAQMNTWLTAAVKSKSQRTDYLYDARGQLSEQVVYTKVNATTGNEGAGIVDGTQMRTQYVYDQSGNLLQKIDARGVATTGVANDYLTSYSYDGLNRLTLTKQYDATGLEANAVSTQVTYTDASRQVKLTLANGLVTTSTYDLAGRLISVQESDSVNTTAGSLGTTSYAYDNLGNLRMVTDVTGQNTYYLYDSDNRKVGEIDPNKNLTEWVYNVNGQVIRTIQYKNTVTATLDATTALTNTITTAGIRPAADATNDRTSYRIYDQAGRLSHEIDALGYVTEYQYDGASRLLRTLEYNTVISAANLDLIKGSSMDVYGINGSIKGISGNTLVLIADATNDRANRNLYDNDGKLVGSLDAEGYLTEYIYDKAASLIQKKLYATATLVSNRANGALALLRSDATSVSADTDKHQTTNYIYDTAGQLTGVVDAENFLTEYQYDLAGNKTQEIRYATSITYVAGNTVIQSRPAGNNEDQKITNTYDANNRITSRLSNTQGQVNGLLTNYTYDIVGNLTQAVKTFTGATSAQERVQRNQYDSRGNLIAQLSGEGVVALLALGTTPTQAQVDTIWNSYGTRYQYDMAGRLVSKIEPNGSNTTGNKTLYYYDNEGKLTCTINALGEVSQTVYNSFDQVAETLRYNTRIASATLTGLTGGADSAVASAITGISAGGVSNILLGYDKRGQLISTTDELTNVNSRTYNAFGQLNNRTDKIDGSSNVVTSYQYDRKGLLKTTTEDSADINRITSAIYDAFGRVTQTSDGRNNVTAYRYDRLGRTVTTTDALSQGTTVAYDAFDRKVSLLDARGNTTSWSYNATNRTMTMTTAESISVVTTVNTFGEVVQVTDGRGSITSYQYNTDGQLTKTIEDSGSGKLNITTENIYDKAGRVYQSKDAKGTITQYNWDPINRVLSKTVDPSGLSLATRYRYDAQGRQIWTQDAKNIWTRMDYDKKGQLTKVVVDPTSVPTNDANGVITGWSANAAGLSLTTSYTYDARGKKLTVIEGDGTTSARTTQYVYDKLGRLTSSIVDPGTNKLNLTTSYTYDKNDNVVLKTDANSNKTVYGYDANNRLEYTVDALGFVERNFYDANGNIVKTRAYKTALAPATLTALQAAPASTTVTVAEIGDDRVTRYGYDKDNRLTYTTNAEWFVTRNEYDANGNVVKRTSYINKATAISETGGAPTVTTHANDRIEQTVYDAANRATYSVDALNYVTANSYDANGNVVTATRYVTPMVGTLTTNTSPQILAAAGSGNYVITSSNDQTTRYSYDKANRRTFSMEANGSVTQYDYDKLGQTLKVTRYANAMVGTPAVGGAPTVTTAPGSGNYVLKDTTKDQVVEQKFDAAGRKTEAIDAEGKSTKTEYNAAGDIVKVTDALGNAGYYYTDAAGRVTLQIDPEGAVTQTQYDGLNNITQVLRFTGKVQTFGTGALNASAQIQVGGTPPSNGVYVATDVAKDQKQTIEYDKLGQTLFVKTWTGATDSTLSSAYYTEGYTYTAFGDVETKTARNGLVTTFTYDKQGRKTSESFAGITVRNAANNANITLKNTFTYNAFGNLLTKVEADGALTTRSTAYVNDKLGHQWQSTQSVQATIGVSASAITQKTFDARGNLVAEKDANGNWTYTYYDKQDRRIATAKADGSYTVWEYDVLGNISKQTQYANKIQTSGTATLSATSSILPVGIAPGGNTVFVITDTANDRITEYTYDKVGRQTGTKLSNITTGTYSTTTQQYTVVTDNITTKTDYDALGNAIKQTDGNGNVTRSWYNKAGQLVAKLDAEGYLTVWDRDVYGNISKETRYANKVQLSGTATLDSSVPVPVDVAPGGNSVYVVRKATDDRITNIVYDKLNRVITETINNVQAGSVNATTGVLTAASSTNVTTSYQYDGLNNVIQKTDATSAVTNWEYDGLGRELSVINPQFNDFEGNAVRTRTDKEYDGLSNVTREIRRGRDNAVETDDQITTYTYGVGGRLISEKDATNSETQYEYDLNGNVTKQVLKDRRNANQTVAGTGVDDVTTYTYDSLNRQTKTTDLGTTVVQEVQYNSFNQIEQKRTYTTNLTPTTWDEYTQYDKAGKVWKSNSGDGVTKVYINDKNGNATVAISGTLDMRNLTLAQVVNQRSLDNQNNVAQQTMYTYSVYDKRNQAITTVQPSVEVDGNSPVKAGTLQAPSKSSLLNWSYSSNNRFVVDMTQNDGIAWLIGMHTLSTSINIADTSYLGSGNLKLEMIYVDIGQNVQFDSVVKYLDSSGGVFNYSGYYNSERGSGGYDSTLYLLKGSWRFPDTPAMSVKIRLTKETAQGQIQLFNEVVYTDDIRSQLETDNSWIYNWESRPEFNSNAAGVGNNAKVMYISGQPPSTSKLLLSYRPAGSTGAYTTISVPQMFNSAGAAMAGMYAFDWSTLGAGEYEFQYVALDNSGQILNQQSGTFNTTFAASGGGVSLNPANNISYNPPNAVTQIGNSLKKTGGTNGVWTDAGVFSQIGYTGSAYLTARAGQTNLHAMIGLNSDPMTDRNYTSLDYAWYPAADGKLYIYENGANVVAGGYGTYLPSDVLEISYQGTTVNYLKNGTVIRSVTTTAGRTLYMDSSFYNTGYIFDEVKFCSNASSAVDIVLNNDTALVKTAGSNGGAWDSDAFSKIGYTGSAYVSARAGQTNLYAMIGLNSDPMTDKSYTSLDYAWYPAADGKLYIYENGANVVAAGFGAYLPSDVLAVEYQGTTVNYLKNGAVIRSVTTTAGRTLYMDSSFLHTGYIFNDVKFGSNASSATAVVLNNDNSIVKTGANGVWDADVYTTLGYTANAYVSARAGQTNLYGMFGLNNDPVTDKSYTSLDYAWYPAADGNLYIYESGAQIGGFGAYTPSDVLGIEYQGTTIKYLKNGTVMRTATTTANRTFYLDSSFHNSGYTLNDVKFGSTAATAAALLFAPSISAQTPLVIGGIGRALFTNTSIVGMSSGLQLIDQGMDATSVVTRYRLKNSGASWITPSTSFVANSSFGIGSFVLDPAGLSGMTNSNDYEVQFDIKNSSGTVLRTVTGTIKKDASGALSIGSLTNVAVYITSPGNNEIKRSQAYNAFGEIASETDGRGNITSYTYNMMGALTKKTAPTVSVTAENGAQNTTANPVTEYTYDALGRVIAVKDANGNINTQVWLTGVMGNDSIVLEKHADGGIKSAGYDIFGNKRTEYDELATSRTTAPADAIHRIDYTYDNENRLAKVERQARSVGAQRSYDAYAYDAAGNRISHTTSSDITTAQKVIDSVQAEKTFYDSLGRVTKTTSFMGFETNYAYTYVSNIIGIGSATVAGWQKTTTDAVGRTLEDKTDMFNHVTWHQDLGGHQFAYVYNQAGWLTSQTSLGAGSQYSGQNIVYSYYNNGNIKSIHDKALGMYTYYEYDKDGNRTFEGYISLKDASNFAAGAKDYYQYANLSYDAMNRMTSIVDSKARINYEYDAMGNRRMVKSEYYDGVTGSKQTQEYWYKYDSMNRFLISMGTFTGARGSGSIGLGATGTMSSPNQNTAVSISYNQAGQRTQAIYASNNSTESYTYTNDGYLTDVKINNVLRSSRTNDALGRVRTYNEYATNYTKTTSYDKDNRVTQETGTDGTTDYFYYINNMDSTGTAVAAGAGQLARVQNVKGGTTVNTYYAYEYWDESKQLAITNQGYNPTLKKNNAFWKPGYSDLKYDVNGHLAGANDAGADGNRGSADDRSFRYVTDAQGLILLRDEIAGTSVNRVQRFYYVNGKRVGDVGNDGPGRTDYVQAMAGRGVSKTEYKNFKPVSSADFDQNYEPVSPSYPGFSATSYTVKSGETLQSIAQAVWGDSAMWYLIADANGLASNSELVAGQVLTIPNKITNVHNNSSTYRVYNPGEAIGDVNPTLPTAPPPPKKKKGGCGGFAMIIVAVVAVVATVLTAGAMAPVLGQTMWSAGLTALGSTGTLGFGGAFLAGAVGSIAGQAAGMALGVQDKFNWGAVATAGLTASVLNTDTMRGLTQAIGKTAGSVGGGYAAVAARAVVGNVVGQGVGNITGTQKGFSWSSVAVSAIAAPVTAKLNDKLFGEVGFGGLRTGDWAFNNPTASAFAESAVSAGVSALTQLSVQGGKLNWSSIAADTLSSFVPSRELAMSGNELSVIRGEAIASGFDQRAASAQFKASALAFMADQPEIDPKLLSKLSPTAEFMMAANGKSQDTLRQILNSELDIQTGLMADNLMFADAIRYAGGSSSQSGYAQALGLSEPAMTAFVNGNLDTLDSNEYVALSSRLGRAGVGGSVVASIADILGEVAAGASNKHAVAGALIGGASTLLDVIDQYPSLQAKFGEMRKLVNPDAIAKTIGDKGALRALPGFDWGSVRDAFQGIMEESYNLINKVEKRLVSIADKSQRFKAGGKLLELSLNNAKERGIIGEALTGVILERSGLYEANSVRAIQNDSGQGIDMVGKAVTGKHAGDWVAFEIKTSAANNFKFNKYQRMGPNSYMERVLSSAASGNAPRWRNVPDVSAFAERVEKEMRGKEFAGYIIKSSYVNTKPHVTAETWPKFGK